VPNSKEFVRITREYLLEDLQTLVKYNYSLMNFLKDSVRMKIEDEMHINCIIADNCTKIRISAEKIMAGDDNDDSEIKDNVSTIINEADKLVIFLKYCSDLRKDTWVGVSR